MGETAQQPATVSTRQPIPGVAGLRVNPERIERMWQMTPAQRVEAARQGRFTLGEMLRWASRFPSEVELVDGEWWFITAYLADAAAEDTGASAQAFCDGEYTAVPVVDDDTSPVDRQKASSDTSRPAMTSGRGSR